MDTALSPVGEEQARLIGQRLKNEVYDQVISSDLKRCRDTTEIIRAQSLQKYSPWFQNVIYDKRIRE